MKSCFIIYSNFRTCLDNYSFLTRTFISYIKPVKILTFAEFVDVKRQMKDLSFTHVFAPEV